eukprot:s1834_g10.t1
MLSCFDVTTTDLVLIHSIRSSTGKPYRSPWESHSLPESATLCARGLSQFAKQKGMRKLVDQPSDPRSAFCGSIGVIAFHDLKSNGVQIPLPKGVENGELFEAFAEYLPNHLDQFGPKDVVGVCTALGRLKERDEASLLAIAGLVSMDIRHYSVRQLAEILTAFARLRVREASNVLRKRVANIGFGSRGTLAQVMAPLDWDKAGEVLDPADFQPEDLAAEKVLDMALSKMDPKKKQGYIDQLKSTTCAVQAPVAIRNETEVAKSEDELLAKIKAEGRKATAEEIEELLARRRQRWRATAPKSQLSRPLCAGCTGEGPRPYQCGSCKSVRYCSPECQRGHWKAHKKKCRKRLSVQICVLSDFA